MTISGTAWSSDDDAMLENLWRGGRSASQIAAAMPGMRTRSSVIGRIHRLRISRDKSDSPNKIASRRDFRRPRYARPPKPQRMPGASAIKDAGATARVQSLRLNVEAAETYVEREHIPPPAARADKPQLLALKDRECRFPIGDPQSPDFHFCGAPLEQRGMTWRFDEQPYCPYHYSLSHQPPAPRR